jgi:phospholipid-binding lipoprotein MlaA
MQPTTPPCIMKNILALIMTLAIGAAISGCATNPSRNPEDPLENINRATFKFNDVLDRKVAIPLAKGYTKVVPDRLRTMVYNFFSNMGDVTVMTNNLAQGRLNDGAHDFVRIVTNTIFGLGGLFDMATPAGLPKHNQDLGLTLGHWGIPNGPYFVMPIFGPSSFRDTVGFVGDFFQLNPIGTLAPAERNSLYALQFVSARARYLGATNLLEAAALDKYSFTRDAYLGRRRYLLNAGKEENLPNYDEDTAPGSPPADNRNENPSSNRSNTEGATTRPAAAATTPPVAPAPDAAPQGQGSSPASTPGIAPAR